MGTGCDFPEIHELLELLELLEDYGYTIHIQLKVRGWLHTQRTKLPAYRSRHWVVERTHSWMNLKLKFAG